MLVRLARLLRAGFILLGAGVPALTVSTASAATPHYVFAHYMVCFDTYGDTVTNYKREIQEAQAAGIDGFALNVGAWSGPDTYYKTRVAAIYNAAEQLGTGFKLFFSIDLGSTNDIVDMVSTYANWTNSFRYQGKVVLSTFGQNALDWQNSVFAPLHQQGIDVFFVPHFWPNPVQELPSYQDAVNILNTYSNVVDGLFLFGAAGLPYQLAQCNSNYTLAVHAAGKIFMASVTPHYWGCAQPTIGRRYFETDGGEGLALQWNSIITNQPDWVEITTWNDFNESTYVSPVDTPGQYVSSLQTPTRFCHSGYLELSKHYISWYKSGTEPTITADELFYFYRTHPKNAVASNTNDIPVTWFNGNVQDTLYTTLFLTAPANLEIASGGSFTTNTLTAGWHNLRMPFSPGAQNITVRRNGFPVLPVQGPDIQSQIQVYDFFPASGAAFYRPGSPVNFRTVGP